MKKLVTSVRVEIVGGHDVVHVWTRGGKSGTLTVNLGDGDLIAKRLMGYEVKDAPEPKTAPKSMGFCQKCRGPVVLGDETWGYTDARGDWHLSLDGYLHHKGCTS
jgi:hypothetical protein